MSLHFEYTIVGGALVGLASTLHCAGMCGPIGSGLLFTVAPDRSPRQRLKAILMAQLGKAGSYALAGFALGSLGSGFFGLFNREAAFLVAQWAAAATLCWVGLSVAGYVPSLAALDRLSMPITELVTSIRRANAAHLYDNAALAGVFWGLLPCGMVYAALLSSMLTGDAIAGAFFMLGFALGTVSSVTLASLGITSLKSLSRSDNARLAVGLTIAATGILGAILTAPGGPFCYTP